MFGLKRVQSDGEQKVGRLLSMAKLFYTNRDFISAKNYLNDLLAVKPNSSEAYKLMSQINEALGEHDLASKNYNKSLELRVSYDHNSSMENSPLFTPTKVSPVISENKIHNLSQENGDSLHLEFIEKLFDKKFSMFENKLNSFSKVFENLNETVNKNYEELISCKKKIVDLQKKVINLTNKQEEFSNKLITQSTLAEKNDLLNEKFEQFNKNFVKLTHGNNKIFEELENLKETVKELSFANQGHDDYEDEEEEDYNDYYNESSNFPQTNQLNLTEQPKLSELFKSKNDEWTCSACYTKNSLSDDKCVSCETPQDPNKETQQTSMLNGFSNSELNSNSSFKFGNFAPTSSGFNFGNTLSTLQAPSTNSFKIDNSKTTTTTTSSFSLSNALNTFSNNSFPTKNVTFTVTSSSSSLFNSTNSSSLFGQTNSLSNTPIFSMPSVPSTNLLNSNSDSKSLFFDSKSTGNFSFGNGLSGSSLFKTNLNLESSPINTSELELKDAEKENSFEKSVHDADYFKLPDVKLPENYEQITGEESEIVLMEKKTKLYIFKESEYKERGVGVVKILKDKKTSKLRMLMRRDVILKVCLNTNLTSSSKFDTKDKFLTFSCIDHSEDNITPGIFLMKFKNMDVMLEFKQFLENLIKQEFYVERNENDNQNADDNSANNICDESEDVEIVYFKQPSPEHKEKTNKLRLPINFYDYLTKPPCTGCIGCRVEELEWSELTQSQDDVDKSKLSINNSIGLFSSITSEINLNQSKVDNISFKNETEKLDAQNFVNEKSKLLPENFQNTTGEENETVLFSEIGKLYRFVESEWKERGRGTIKILKQNDKNEYRFLMRRDIIFNVICNHKIYKDINIKSYNESSVHLTWYAIDFSEDPNGTKQIFLLKLKNEAIVNNFKSIINDCIDALTT